MAEVGDALVTMEWRDILTATWAADPAMLVPLVPRGTELDLWNGEALVSLVAFRFLDLRVAGIPVPLHQNFEQINFRFYVRRQVGDAVRRGVVFVKEIVPSVAMTLGARFLFNENYFVTETRHERQPGEKGWVVYEWRVGERWNRLSATRGGLNFTPGHDSIEVFLQDRPWGYTTQPAGSTMEHHVEHPAWDVWPTEEMLLDCDVAPLFGAEWVPVLSAQPISTFIAVGSAATLRQSRRL